jgi:hypothetical protein
MKTIDKRPRPAYAKVGLEKEYEQAFGAMDCAARPETSTPIATGLLSTGKACIREPRRWCEALGYIGPSDYLPDQICKIARMAWAMVVKGERYKEPAALAA